MSTFKDPSQSSHPYSEPAPLPESVPKVQELGTTSAPLKSAAFFIGAYCKEYNGELSLFIMVRARSQGVGVILESSYCVLAGCDSLWVTASNVAHAEAVDVVELQLSMTYIIRPDY